MAVPKLQLLSRTQYDTDGTTTVWDFNFSGGYILQDHVKAYYDSVGGVRTPVVVTPAMLIGTWQLQITPAIPAGNVLTIYRATPKDRPMVDFTDRGYISEVALDTLARQAVFVAAEASDDTVTANSEVAVNAAAQAQAGQAGAVAARASAVAAAAAADEDRIAADASAVAAANAATGVAAAEIGDNLLINGAFAINQRGYSPGAATVAANQYTLDRWRIATSGQYLLFYASGLGNFVIAPAGGVEQVVEGNNIAGGTYVLNWVGTATASVNNQARAQGETFTLTAGANATVRFVGGTVSLAKLQSGSLATAYKHRPFSTELALCQRYYQMVGAGFASAVTGGAAYGAWVPFVVPMRAAPTVALFNPIIAVAFATTAGGLSSVRAEGVLYYKGATASSQSGQYLDILSASAEL